MLALLGSLLHGGAVAAQSLDAHSLPQCSTPPNSVNKPQGITVPGNSCAQYPEYSPQAYDERSLPTIPLKTVRIMFHVFQKNDGTGNWQTPAQDGGADEALLRGLVSGLTEYPAGSGNYTADLRGLNNIYAHLDQRGTQANPGPGSHGTPDPGISGDTRIRFQLEGIRYYRNTNFWDMTNGSPVNCGNSCLNQYYTTFIANSTASQDVSGTVLPADQRGSVIHLFFGENPGLPSTLTDQFGNPSSRYGFGGYTFSFPQTLVNLRGFYWTLKHHPFWSAGGVRNSDPHQAFKYLSYVLAHELGHCLGLGHTYDGSEACCDAPFADPPTTPTGENNNVMGSPYVPGFSLSTCQIGKMHYYLGHASELLLPANLSLDNTMVADYCKRDPSQDVHIAAGTVQEWSSAHNLRGDLYVEPGATLTVRCRVGFAGPEAKILVREGGTLVLDNGTLGNYATSALHECDTDLTLWLGGDGSDGDNSGLITIRNGGGFTSTRLTAVLALGATLHVGNVPVLLDGSQVNTKEGSYLCIEPGATLQYIQPAGLSIDPSTILGLNPAIALQADCMTDPCSLMTQLTSFSATTVSTLTGVATVSTLCLGSPVTMSANAPQASSVIWYKDGVPVATTADYTDTPTTGAASVKYSVAVAFANGCPPVAWSFTQPLAPLPALVLIQSTATVCATDGVAPAYTADGWFNLDGLITSLYSDQANQGRPAFWREIPKAVGTLLRSNPVTTHLELNVPEMLARGQSTYQIELCKRSLAAGRCVACATITLNLQNGAAVTVPTPPPSCPGQAVVLQAGGPTSGGYHWDPGNLSGATVTVTPAATTAYTLTYTAANQCPVVRRVTVTVRRPTCLDCLANNYIEVNAQGVSFATYTFLAGKTYVFNQNTVLTAGIFVVPEQARLLFGPNVTLTLRSGAQLDLRGGQLTATCDQMWGGLVAEASSRGVVSQKPASLPYSEISHSRNGLVLTNTAGTSAGQPALQLNYVAFLHNGQGVQVLNQGPPTYAFAGLIVNSLFDSDPHQMLAPWQYVSAQDLHVSQRHLAFTGKCTALTVQDCTFDHALFGVWVPTAAPFTATRNVFRNMFIAGLYAYDALTADTHLTFNQFLFPAPAAGSATATADDIIRSHSPQLQAAFAVDLASEGPTSLLHEGACAGIFGPTIGSRALPFVLEGNDFVQAASLTTYNMIYPQHGAILPGGAVALRHNTFRNLFAAYMGSASQPGGQVRDNLFHNCVIGVRFLNTQNHTTSFPGDAVVSCNTFERPDGVIGRSYSIIRDYCQAQASSDHCDQIDISTTGTLAGSPFVLQKNRFIHPTAAPSADDTAFDVYNADSNAPMTYSTFTNVVSSIIVNNGYVLLNDYNLMLTSSANATTANPANDCASETFSNGLQGRIAPPSPPSTPGAAVKPVAFLAQNVPNPCSGTTSVSYYTNNGSGEAELVIRDYFSGAVVLRQAVPMGEHTVEVSVAKLRPGSYHYALVVGGRPVAHHNLLVQ